MCTATWSWQSTLPQRPPAVLRPKLPCPSVSSPTQVLVEKCLGRRLCRKCGKNYNIADIYLPASNGRPEIVMPPLNPPAECMQASFELLAQKRIAEVELVGRRAAVCPLSPNRPRLALASLLLAGAAHGATWR